MWIKRLVGVATFAAVLGMGALGLGAAGGLLTLAPRVAFADSPGPGPGGPGPGGSTFQLNSFTAMPVPGKSDEFYLNVSVSQNHMDGSDFTRGSNTETHPLPQNLYFYVADSSGNPVKNSPLFNAILVSSNPSNGITYNRSGTGSVTGTAEYQVTIPSKDYTSSDELMIYPYGTPGYTIQQDAFRMGKPSDSSFPDDVVSGTTSVTLPVNNLPEVPFAVALPAILAGAFLLLRRGMNARTEA